jgi:hypothetical protein
VRIQTAVQRWKRLFLNLSRFLPGKLPVTHAYPGGRGWALVELPFCLTDAFLVPELLMLLHRVFKFRARKLNAHEEKLVHRYFGARIKTHNIRIDEKAWLGKKQYGSAYVSMSDVLFIHEMVHVWQFQTHGSVYIPRALWAQRTDMGYNYGGVQALRMAVLQGRSLSDFNYEQQADIISDYFCLQNNLKPRWCSPDDQTALPVFETLIYPFGQF